MFLRDNIFTQTLWEVSHQTEAFMHLCSVVFVVLGALVLNSYFDNDPLVNYDDIVVVTGRTPSQLSWTGTWHLTMYIVQELKTVKPYKL